MFLEPFDSKLAEFGSEAGGQKQGDYIDIYIPGAGFAGFFYTLGRLQALHDNSSSSSYEYFCFSAGCLALITSLLNLPIDSAIELAHASRNRWIMGEISRYDVVEYFVDGLLSDIENVKNNTADSIVMLPDDEKVNATSDKRTTECDKMGSIEYALQRHALNLQDFLPRINVITSEWSKKRFLSQNIQKPSSIEHLRRILVQTTWIPFVTGASFGDLDHGTGLHHNDGAFAGLFQNFIPQPKSELRFQPCRYHYSLLLPWSFDLLSNGLNILLSHEEAAQFWRDGLRRGVQ